MFFDKIMEVIRLNESQLKQIIQNTVRDILRESIDEMASGKTTRRKMDWDMIDSLDTIDKRTFKYYLTDLFDAFRTGSPYRAFKQFVMFWGDNGTALHSKDGRRLLDMVSNSSSGIGNLVRRAIKADNDISELIKSTGSIQQIYDDVSYRLDDVNKLMNEFMQSEELRDIARRLERFGDTEVLMGSPDGKRKGLYRIAFHAGQGIHDVNSRMRKLGKLIQRSEKNKW